MKRSSVFVLLILALGAACGEKKARTVADLSGKYTLMRKQVSLIDRWFSRPNVTGWDYDSDAGMELFLLSDSTYRLQSPNSCFGYVPSEYRGTWRIQNDSVFLDYWFQMGRVDGPPNPKVWYEDTLLIHQDGHLIVWTMPYTFRDKILVRR